MKKFNDYLELVFEADRGSFYAKKGDKTKRSSFFKNPKTEERQIGNRADRVIDNLNDEIDKSYIKFRTAYINSIENNQYLDFKFYNNLYGQNKEKTSEDIKTLISKNESINDLYFALELYKDAVLSGKAHVSKSITGLQILVALAQEIQIGSKTKNISLEIVKKIGNKDIKTTIENSLKGMFN